MLYLSPELVRLTKKWTNLGLFQIRFQYILALLRQNVLKSDLKKSQICPIWGVHSDPLWSQTYHPWTEQSKKGDGQLEITMRALCVYHHFKDKLVNLDSLVRTVLEIRDVCQDVIWPIWQFFQRHIRHVHSKFHHKRCIGWKVIALNLGYWALSGISMEKCKSAKTHYNTISIWHLKCLSINWLQIGPDSWHFGQVWDSASWHGCQIWAQI